MSLVIYNKSTKESFLNLVKRFIFSFLGVRRGPGCVTRSLLLGLDELGINYKFNPNLKEIKEDDIIYVNESIEALVRAIEIKKAGGCAKLIVGPAITVLPEEFGGIMLDKNIDVILQPAGWVRDMWIKRKPELEQKIKVWWAGVDMVGGSKKDNGFVLYNKDASAGLVKFVQAVLKEENISYKEIKYGHYKQSEYFKFLSHAKGAIFLSQSESQGLALSEAWMHDVPTLVWSAGEWRYKDEIVKDEKISAPYLNEKNGLLFSGEKDFSKKLEIFLSRLDEFSSRSDALENFIHKKCAQNFLNLIK